MKFKIAIGICVGLVVYGVMTVALSHGFFTDLLGAGMLALGGGSAYLLLTERRSLQLRARAADQQGR